MKKERKERREREREHCVLCHHLVISVFYKSDIFRSYLPMETQHQQTHSDPLQLWSTACLAPCLKSIQAEGHVSKAPLSGHPCPIGQVAVGKLSHPHQDAFCTHT